MSLFDYLLICLGNLPLFIKLKYPFIELLHFVLLPFVLQLLINNYLTTLGFLIEKTPLHCIKSIL